MNWRVTADVEKFDEALEWFGSRLPVSDAERQRIPLDARSRAFWIAGAAQLDVVQTVQNELQKAIAAGTGIEDFKKQVRDLLAAQWGKDNPSRIETIFRNATQQAYNAGRYAQMSDPAVLRFRPFWLYDAIRDGRTSAICTACNGTVLPANDPWWDAHWPQQHHRCRCSVRSLRTSEAEKRGVTSTPPTVQADPGFGLSPRLAKEWRPDASSHSPQLMAELGLKQADLSKRPPAPSLPLTFDKRPRAKQPLPEVEETVPIGPGRTAKLTPEQQKAHQLSAHLRRSFEAREQASLEDRRTWMLWEWVRGSNRMTSALVKQAALREFALTGVPWAQGAEHTFQAADIVRAQRDLRALHDQTQAWFKRRGIRAVTLYRVAYGNPPEDARQTVESWTSDRTVAEQYARRRPGGKILKLTVPVSQVLAHHSVSEWLDGPLGPKNSYLLMF